MALACLVAKGAQKDEGPGSSLVVSVAAASVCGATDHTVSFLTVIFTQIIFSTTIFNGN